MACTPAQMGEAIVRNLEAKTGYGLAHWLDVHREGGATDKKSAMAYLKAAGLGHFQAQKVWEASRGETQERGPDTPFLSYAGPEALVREQFSAGQQEAYAALLRDAKAFAKTCHALGADVEARPCRTYVPFYAARQFAMLTAKPDGGLHVGLALPKDFATASEPSLNSAKGLGGSARINASFPLASDGVPTAAQARVLAKAYRHNASAQRP